MSYGIDMRCLTCGRPLAEGPLYTMVNEVYCELHLPDSTEMVCDFCGESDPAWLYNSFEFKLSVLMGEEDNLVMFDAGQRWLSCDGCRTIVDSDEPHSMVNRIVAMRGYPEDMPQLLQDDFKEVMLTYFTVLLEGLVRPPMDYKKLSTEGWRMV